MRFQVGDIRITQVRESLGAIPPLGLFPDADLAVLEANRAWLAPHYLNDDGTLSLSIHALVVESMGKTIVIDTCVGDRPVPGYDAMSNRQTPFLADFAAAGFDVNTVDVVMCTHLHFDHVGCNTMRVGDAHVPTFPNARYLFARTEWEHWRAQPDPGFAATLGVTVEPIFAAGLADLVDGDHVITDEVRLEPTPGHTPGHVSVRIASQGRQALISGDMTHHPVQWAEPAWGIAADSDGAQATRTRERLLDEHADTDLLVIGTHYAPPTAGRIVRRAGRVRFEKA